MVRLVVNIRKSAGKKLSLYPKTHIRATPLYHVTSPDAAESIYREGFRASVDGEQGPGVYLTADPQAVLGPKYRGRVTGLNPRRSAKAAIPVDVGGVRFLEFRESPNNVLRAMEALYGKEKGRRVYDGMADKLKWAEVHARAKQAGCGGLVVIGGAAKNYLVFDPKIAKPIVK